MSATYTTIFCDDIRQEANGKHILIGVYGSDLVPSAFPITFPLAVWLKISDAPRGPHKFKLSLQSPGGSESGVEGDMNIPPEAPANGVVLGFGGFPVQLNGPGTIVALLSIDNAEPEEVGTLQVLPASIG